MDFKLLFGTGSGRELLETASDAYDKIQKEKNRAIPVVKSLTGDEIENDPVTLAFLKEKPDATYFEVVRNYYQKLVQGQKIIHPFIGEIHTSGLGWGKIKNGATYKSNRTIMIPALLEILTHGRCHHIETARPGQKKDIAHVAYLQAIVNLQGQPIDVTVNVSFSSKLNRFLYNVTTKGKELHEGRDQEKYEGVVPIAGYDSSIDAFDSAAGEEILNIFISKSSKSSKYLEGRHNKVKTAKGTQLDTNLAVIEAGDLIASHDHLGKANELYPQELQPRDRSRQSSQQQIHNIAKELDPDSLGRSNRADSGAPIIGPDLVVESGNGRTIAIKLAYAQHKADDYRDWIVENADYFGVNPKTVAKMKEPVLVRVRKTEVNRAQFAVEANQDDKLSYSATERAKSDAKRITGPLLDLFNPDDQGNFISAGNMKFIQGFLTNLGEHEAAQYLTTDGKPTQALVTRIKCAVFSKAYNDDRLLEMVADQTKPDLQNLLNALMIAAPKFIEAQAVNGAVKGHIEDVSSGIIDGIEKSIDQRIVDAILDAANVIEKAKFNNQAVGDYVDQLGLFGDLPEGVAELAVFIATNSRSAKKLSMAFKAMAEYAEKTAIDSQTFSLFGDPEPISIKDAVNYANTVLADAYGDGKSQINMFDDATNKANFQSVEGKNLGPFSEQTIEPKPMTNGNFSMSENPISRLLAMDAKAQPLNTLRLALECIMYKGTEPAFKPSALVEYTTQKKGKVLQGIVISFDIENAEEKARAIDPYTFKYQNGWFVRLKHLKTLNDTQALTPEQIELKEDLSNASNSGRSAPGVSERGGRTSNPANSTHESNTAGSVDGATSGSNGGSGDQRNGTAGLSEDNASGSTSGRNQPATRKPKRSIASTSFTADDGQPSGVSNGPGSSTVRKRDRSTLQSAKKTGSELTGKALLQLNAEGTATEWANSDNIADSLPFLLDDQHDDVLKAEKRLIEEDENGILFTNGTGTGKTFTGLGSAKRFMNAGKKNILIVSMNNKIVKDFIKSAKALNMNVHQLEDTNDNGGEEHSIVATTYANLAKNDTLADKHWDLILVDESHNLMQSEDGKITAALRKIQALTGHHAGFDTWFDDKHRAERPERVRLETPVTDEDGNPVTDKDGNPVTEWIETNSYVEGPKRDAWFGKMAEQRDLWKKNWNSQPKGRTKVIFLSATPFSYVKNVEWAEGFLFHYVDPAKRWNDENEGGKYNSGDDREQFFMRGFGYTMRYNKMTSPNGKVNAGVNEREFANKLKENGAMSGRELSVPFDYDRKFILIRSAIGQQIDRGLDVLFTEQNDDGRHRYASLLRQVLIRFDYLSRQRLLEAIKADAVIDQIKKSVALGRKVIVFHDYNTGGGFSPFNFESGGFQTDTDGSAEAQYDRFRIDYPDLVALDLDFDSPIVTLKAKFPDALLFNGTVGNAQRIKNADLFNEDNNGRNIIIVQSDAGSTGISFHDTTGVHQRVIFNLGLPKKPAKLRQTEGRIYRVGQASNAIHRYLTTGTKWETSAFANVIAQRAETVDNLAKGDDAVVSIRDAIISAYENATYFEPSLNDGIGGKAYDEENARIARMTPFDKALTAYHNKGKNRDNRQNKIGKDWYATPEPVGLKMVQWAGVHKGDDVLEPSAGDGAIGRWVSEDANLVMIEPSNELASRAQLANTTATVHNGSFEVHNTMIKYDAIVMNPPFGHAGSLALEHVKKACKHLREGGRVVALVPNSPNLLKGLETWQQTKEGQEFYMVAKVSLPSSTFENANTSVNTFVMILERHSDAADAPYMRNIDLSTMANNDELFEAIRDVDFGPRKLRDDEALAEYGLSVEPFREKYLITGIGVSNQEIRDTLLNNTYMHRTNSLDTLEVRTRNVPAWLKALREKNAPKVLPHDYNGFDAWQHDGIYDRINLSLVKVDLKKYVRQETKATMKGPIVVQERGTGYVLLTGYERFRLAKETQEHLVPAIVIDEQYIVTREIMAKAYLKTAHPLDPETYAQRLLDVLEDEAMALLN